MKKEFKAGDRVSVTGKIPGTDRRLKQCRGTIAVATADPLSSMQLVRFDRFDAPMDEHWWINTKDCTRLAKRKGTRKCCFIHEMADKAVSDYKKTGKTKSVVKVMLDVLAKGIEAGMGRK